MAERPRQLDRIVVRRRSRRAAVAVLAMIVLVAGVSSLPAVRRSALRAIGHALVAEDAIVEADVVVVPEWAGGDGALEVADIVRSGRVRRVAVLPGPMLPPEREFRRRGVRYENDADRLTARIRALAGPDAERLPNTASGTESEGEELADWCVKNHVRSIVVVSPPDHSRRLRRVLRRSMRRCAATVSIQPTHFSVFEPDHWWETRDGLRIGLVELEKLILDAVRHPLS